MKEKNKNDQLKEYDYSAYDNDRRFRGRILTDDQRKELRQISDQIAESFDISNRDAHFALLTNLSIIMDTGSDVKLREGQIAPPVDQPTFKKTKEELLEKLRDHLGNAVEIMREVTNNETFAATLHLSDEDGKLDQHFHSLTVLARVADHAASMSGRSGPQPNEDWIEEFCVACQVFWKTHKDGGIRFMFHLEQESPITEWVYTLFKNMQSFKGHPDETSKLMTAAKKLKVNRAQNSAG